MPDDSESSAPKPKRGKGKPFQKGVSGNPGGKGRLDGEIRRMARDAGPMAIQRLIHWAASKNPKASIAASNALLDRGFGKAAATLNLNDDRDPLRLDLVREAAAEVLRDPEARTALRLAMRGGAAGVDTDATPVLDRSAEPTPDLSAASQIGTVDHSWFHELLSKHRRVCIAGGPRVGKTTLSNTVSDRAVIHTDDSMALGWDEQPEAIMHALAQLGHAPWLLEGVQVGRCLRKGLMPDVVVWLDEPYVRLTSGQSRMREACKTIFSEWIDQKLIANRYEIRRGLMLADVFVLAQLVQR